VGPTHFGTALIGAVLGLLLIFVVEVLTFVGPVVTIALLVGKRSMSAALIWGALTCLAWLFRLGIWMRWF
jgi:hypothetical protein